MADVFDKSERSFSTHLGSESMVALQNYCAAKLSQQTSVPHQARVGLMGH